MGAPPPGAHPSSHHHHQQHQLHKSTHHYKHPRHHHPHQHAKDLEAGGHVFQPCERVVIFTAAYYVCDGVSLTIRKLRTHLLSKGIASRVVSCGPEGWNEPDVLTVPAIPLPIVNADDNFGYSLGIKLTDACKAQIKKFEPSLIHFTVPDFLALDALRWAKGEGIPVMGTWHSNYSDYLKFYQVEFMRGFVEKYIRSFYVNMPIYVPTPFIRTKLLDNGFPKQRVGIWGRGVNLGLFNPTTRSLAFRRSKGIADDEVVILWVGRLVKEKSPDIWAEVIRRLHRVGLNFRALVVGTGSYEEHMKRLPRTECLGWMSGAALAEVYASVDVFLFPSEVETFGNVTLEALASGVPCIASAGCSGHLVYHGVNGFVVHQADVDEYYELTKRLVLDGTLRQKLAGKARPSILTLEHGRVMDMMVANYEHVIKEHHAQGLGDPSQRKTGDRYMVVVYYFFSMVVLLITPTLKAYVAVLKAVQRAWATATGKPQEGGEKDVEEGGSSSTDKDGAPQQQSEETAAWMQTLASLVVAVGALLSSLTFKEMRVLMLIVYLFALYVLWQTLSSAMT